MALELAAAVFAASVMGSLHCAAMCGPLVGSLACGPGSGSAQQQASYHAGRLLMYGSLGVLAGALGSAVNLVGSYAGFVDIAGIVAGVLILVAGLGSLAATLGIRVPEFVRTTGVQRWLGQRLTRSGMGPLVRAAVLGVSSALLPCGWLYAFVIVAAGTGSPVWGGIVLVAFWGGTVPALLGVSAIVNRLGGALKQHVPLLSAALFVALGLGTILHRVNIPAHALSQVEQVNVLDGANPAALPCHTTEAP